MATTVQVFDNHDFGAIRTINDGGHVLFCGKDVATALGYVKDDIELIVDGGVRITAKIDAVGRDPCASGVVGVAGEDYGLPGNGA